MNIYFLQKIETSRLTIRPVQIGDEHALSKAINNSLPSLQRWMPWAKDPSFRTTQAFVHRSVRDWQTEQLQEFPMVVIHKANNKIIAASGYNEKSDLEKSLYEIGYWIDVDYQGQGFITEMVNALTRYAFIALHANRVQICTQTENIRSIAVAERCGYKLDAIMRNYCIDCESGLPTNSFLFSCCNIEQLPPLNIAWQHKEKKKILLQDATIPSDTQPPTPLPRLNTKNIALISPRMADAAKLHLAIIASLSDIGPWFHWENSHLKLQSIEQYLHKAALAASDIYSHNSFLYLVWANNYETLAGELWLKILDWSYPPSVMINYWFDRQCTEKGFSKEAIIEVIKYAFSELKARRVQLQIATLNTQDIKLARMLGFLHEGTLANHAENSLTKELISSELFSITALSDLIE